MSIRKVTDLPEVELYQQQDYDDLNDSFIEVSYPDYKYDSVGNITALTFKSKKLMIKTLKENTGQTFENVYVTNQLCSYGKTYLADPEFGKITFPSQSVVKKIMAGSNITLSSDENGDNASQATGNILVSARDQVMVSADETLHQAPLSCCITAIRLSNIVDSDGNTTISAIPTYTYLSDMIDLQ